jgi:hypothetical protein
MTWFIIDLPRRLATAAAPVVGTVRSGASMSSVLMRRLSSEERKQPAFPKNVEAMANGLKKPP